MSIRGYRGVTPKIAATAYIDPSAQVIGDVVVGERSSIWPNTTVRGDVHSIRIGDETNVQDNCCLHVQRDEFPLILGNRVSIGALGDAARLHDRRRLPDRHGRDRAERRARRDRLHRGGGRAGDRRNAGAAGQRGDGHAGQSAARGDASRIARAFSEHADSYIMYRQIYLDEEAQAQ